MEEIFSGEQTKVPAKKRMGRPPKGSKNRFIDKVTSDDVESVFGFRTVLQQEQETNDISNLSESAISEIFTESVEPTDTDTEKIDRRRFNEGGDTRTGIKTIKPGNQNFLIFLNKLSDKLRINRKLLSSVAPTIREAARSADIADGLTHIPSSDDSLASMSPSAGRGGSKVFDVNEQVRKSIALLIYMRDYALSEKNRMDAAEKIISKMNEAKGKLSQVKDTFFSNLSDNDLVDLLNGKKKGGVYEFTERKEIIEKMSASRSSAPDSSVQVADPEGETVVVVTPPPAPPPPAPPPPATPPTKVETGKPYRKNRLKKFEFRPLLDLPE